MLQAAARALMDKRERENKRERERDNMIWIKVRYNQTSI
jgi:hypothetical protein